MNEELQPSFTCPTCRETSYLQQDIDNGYCGNCHDFTGEPPGVVAHPPGVDPMDQVLTVGGKPLHRSRAGRPMTMRQWMWAQNNPEIRIVRRTFLVHDGERLEVLTVWTGLWDPWTEHGGGFETKVRRDGTVTGSVRSSSESAASQAHQVRVDSWVDVGWSLRQP